MSLLLPWYVLGLLAALLWSVHVVLSKKVLLKEHAVQYLTLFCTLIFIWLLPFAGKVDFDLSLSVYGLTYLTSLFWTIGMVLMYRALRHLEVSASIPLENLSVLVVFILGIFLLGEQLKVVNMLGVLCLVGGSVLLWAKGKDALYVFHSKNRKFFIYAVVANLFYGLSQIVDKILVSPQELNLSFIPVDSFSLFFLSRFFLVVNLWALTFIFYGGLSDALQGWKAAWVLIVVTSLIDALANFFYFLALPLTYIALLSPVVALYTFFDVILGGRVFHEGHTTKRLAACVFMLVGVYLVVI